MVGLFIAVFVKRKLLGRISGFTTAKLKTGLGGKAGNKGAVAIRFQLDNTPIMLVNCHLMSGKGKGLKRLEEIRKILLTVFNDKSRDRVKIYAIK